MVKHFPWPILLRKSCVFIGQDVVTEIWPTALLRLNLWLVTTDQAATVATVEVSMWLGFHDSLRCAEDKAFMVCGQGLIDTLCFLPLTLQSIALLISSLLLRLPCPAFAYQTIVYLVLLKSENFYSITGPSGCHFTGPCCPHLYRGSLLHKTNKLQAPTA